MCSRVSVRSFVLILIVERWRCVTRFHSIRPHEAIHATLTKFLKPTRRDHDDDEQSDTKKKEKIFSQHPRVPNQSWAHKLDEDRLNREKLSIVIISRANI